MCFVWNAHIAMTAQAIICFPGSGAPVAHTTLSSNSSSVQPSRPMEYKSPLFGSSPKTMSAPPKAPSTLPGDLRILFFSLHSLHRIHCSEHFYCFAVNYLLVAS